MAARIAWGAPAAGGSVITGYEVERNRASAGFTLIGSPTGLFLLDVGAQVGDQYRVRAVNAIGPGAWSNTGTYNGAGQVFLSHGRLLVDATTAPAEPRLLLRLGQNSPTAAQFGSGKATYESRPFDGWTVATTDAQLQSWWSSTPISQATWAAALADFPTGMVQAKNNFIHLRVNASISVDWWNDAFWAVVFQNAQNLCAAIVASGKQIDGIFFDSEIYDDDNPGTPLYNHWNYGTAGGTTWASSATEYPTANRTATEARDKLVQRGVEMMTACATAWPTVKILSSYTPAISENITYTDANGFNWANNFSASNELKGCFYYGLAKATFTAYPQAQYIDGNEPTYEVRTQERADRAKNWAAVEWPTKSTHIIPSAEAATYVSKAGYGPAMYDKDAFNAYVLHTAANLQTYLTLVMKTADRYCWLYTEFHEWGTRPDGKPAVTQEYIDAVAAARLAAR